MRNAWLILACSLFGWAQSTPPTGTPARIIVTIGHLYTTNTPALTRDDLTVTQEYEPLPITKLIPLRGDRAALEMFILVDNCSDCEPGTKVDELHKFITSQPPTTTIGVAYIQNGRLEIAEKPTTDRDRAIKALNAPTGSKRANPFNALADLIKGWPQNSSRHVVLMISNGIDPAAGDQIQDQSAEGALEAAQLAGVTVYAIYHPSADYASADYAKLYNGQILLAHVGYETGGEAYFTSFGPMRSIAPFLADIADHLVNQYVLEFLARPGEASGTLQDVRVKCNLPVEIMVPGRVLVPALTKKRK